MSAALLICSTLVTGILSKMYDQDSEMRMTGEIWEENDEMLPRNPVRSDESSRIDDVLDIPGHLTSSNRVTPKAEWGTSHAGRAAWQTQGQVTMAWFSIRDPFESVGFGRFPNIPRLSPLTKADGGRDASERRWSNESDPHSNGGFAYR